MAKKQKPLVEINTSEKIVELHVFGDLLYNKVFEQILNSIKENREYANPKKIHIVVYSASMYKIIRYSVPSEYIDKVIVGGLSSNIGDAAGKDEFLDAVGM